MHDKYSNKRENVKVAEEFVVYEVAKVEINNKEKDKHYFLCIFKLMCPFPLFFGSFQSLHKELSKEYLHVLFGGLGGTL